MEFCQCGKVGTLKFLLETTSLVLEMDGDKLGNLSSTKI